MNDKSDLKALESVDETRRSALKKLIIGAAFAVPVIASFSMSQLGTNEAEVYSTNQTGGGGCGGHEHGKKKGGKW